MIAKVTHNSQAVQMSKSARKVRDDCSWKRDLTQRARWKIAEIFEATKDKLQKKDTADIRTSVLNCDLEQGTTRSLLTGAWCSYLNRLLIKSSVGICLIGEAHPERLMALKRSPDVVLNRRNVATQRHPLGHHSFELQQVYRLSLSRPFGCRNPGCADYANESRHVIVTCRCSSAAQY